MGALAAWPTGPQQAQRTRPPSRCSTCSPTRRRSGAGRPSTSISTTGHDRLAAGTRTRVTGRLAGVPVGFDVEVHAADEEGLRLSADGPIGIDVRYELVPANAGAELNASVSLRRGAASPAGLWPTPPPPCSPPELSTAPPDASPARPKWPWRHDATPRRRTLMLYDTSTAVDTIAGDQRTRRWRRTISCAATATGDSAVEAVRGVSLERAGGPVHRDHGRRAAPASPRSCTCSRDSTGPPRARVEIGGQDITAMGDKQLTLLRREHIGFVFQAFNLVPTLTAEENVTLPLAIAGRQARARLGRRRARAGRARRPPHAPAGRAVGRPAAARRRGARARLASRPSCSPTSRPATSTRARAPRCSTCCARRSADYGQTTVMVTHDPRAAASAERVLFIADGELVTDIESPTEDEVLAH